MSNASTRTDWKRGPARERGKRVADGAWEEFLGYLASMSASDASKKPGMPSRAAFAMRRKRHPDFDRIAASIISARKLQTSGRRRITRQQWASFLVRIDTCCISRICKEPGMPSEAAVYKRRANDAAFAAEIQKTLRARIQLRLEAAIAASLAARFPAGWVRTKQPRPYISRSLRRNQTSGRRPEPGEIFKEQLNRNELYAFVASAIPREMSPIARDDIMADMMLAILEGRIERENIKAHVGEFTKQHWKLFGTFKNVSLDAPIYQGSNITIGDSLTYEGFAA